MCVGVESPPLVFLKFLSLSVKAVTPLAAGGGAGLACALTKWQTEPHAV